jgi:hypothetical protein
MPVWDARARIRLRRSVGARLPPRSDAGDRASARRSQRPQRAPQLFGLFWPCSAEVEFRELWSELVREMPARRWHLRRTASPASCGRCTRSRRAWPAGSRRGSSSRRWIETARETSRASTCPQSSRKACTRRSRSPCPRPTATAGRSAAARAGSSCLPSSTGSARSALVDDVDFNRALREFIEQIPDARDRRPPRRPPQALRGDPQGLGGSEN